jgi:hypothetical protein
MFFVYFRLHDGNNDYYSNFVMYKRAKDFTSELNSVPMLGKRDPEPYAAISATSNDDLSAEEGSDPVWASFPEEGNLMGDASLVGSLLLTTTTPLFLCLQTQPHKIFAIKRKNRRFDVELF